MAQQIQATTSPAREQIREIELEPPLGGQSESLAFEQQQPYTSPEIQNCRIFDPDKERARIGQRPGTAKAFTTQVGGAYPVRAMCSIVTTYIQVGS